MIKGLELLEQDLDFIGEQIESTKPSYSEIERRVKESVEKLPNKSFDQKLYLDGLTKYFNDIAKVVTEALK